MKFLHTADLHLGKTVNEFSLLEDQKFILQQIAGLARREQADALVIAGDVYDRSVPPAEAVSLLDSFLTKMAGCGIPVLLVSGNHDSPQRLSFAEALLEKQGVYIAGELPRAAEGAALRQAVLRDEYGEVVFVLLPFVRPAVVGAVTGEEAVRRLLEGNLPEKGGRSVLVTHYFVTDAGREPERSDSENTIQIGGIDNVDASCFAAFSYTALGHIHKPQRIGKGEVWYAGAPLAYSFSEAGQEKSVNLVTLGAEGVTQVERLALKPLHPMRKIRGTLEELLRGGSEDYLQAVLTDERELLDPMARLRSVYPNLMQIVPESREGTAAGAEQETGGLGGRTPQAYFEDFVRFVTGREPEEEQREAAAGLWRELEEQG